MVVERELVIYIKTGCKSKVLLQQTRNGSVFLFRFISPILSTNETSPNILPLHPHINFPFAR